MTDVRCYIYLGPLTPAGASLIFARICRPYIRQDTQPHREMGMPPLTLHTKVMCLTLES